ncbi:MAG: hypothetical protein M1118_09420 [Chloroflexi bacterium]|nr:hypothetical protein [Chloroflexota bacterium]
MESTLHDVASITLVSLVAALFGALAESLSQGDFEPLARCVWETGKGTIIVEANGENLLVALVEDPATIGMTRYVLRVRTGSHSEPPGDHDTV